jgi:hypothetical protein
VNSAAAGSAQPHDFILLPERAATTDAAAAYAHFQAQIGQPDSYGSTAVIAALKSWNAIVTEAGKPRLALRIYAAGDTVYASATDEQSARPAREMMVRACAGLGYAIVDFGPSPAPSAATADAAQMVTTTIGDAVKHTAVTEAQLCKWVPNLHTLAATPLLTLSRPDDDLTYIQTYQNGPLDYLLDIRSGSADQHYSVKLTNSQAVAGLMWDWLQGDFTRINQLRWKRKKH